MKVRNQASTLAPSALTTRGSWRLNSIVIDNMNTVNTFDTSLIHHYEDVAYLDTGSYRYFTAGGGSSKLLFFGSRHLFDITEPMFTEIQNVADKAKPDLIFVEGLQGLRRSVHDSQRKELLQKISSMSVKEAVCHYGERGFIIKYAVERGICVECPEPEFRAEVAHITQQGFSRDGVIAYYVYRMVHQWLNSSSPMDLQAYLDVTIEQLKTFTGWVEFDWSFRNIASLSETFWKVPLKFDDKKFYLKGLSPFTNRTSIEASETNQVCAASGLFRDLVIAEEIVLAQQRARSVFALFGSGHSFTLEDALKAAFAGSFDP